MPVSIKISIRALFCNDCTRQKSSYSIFMNKNEVCFQIEVTFSFMWCNLNLIGFDYIVVIQDGKGVLVRNAHFYQVAQRTMDIAPNH